MTELTRRTALPLMAAPYLNLRAQNRNDRPNILWILGDDLGVELGCYGYPLTRTPNADRLANEGVRFTHCFTTAPVCSAARSAWNTGVYQTTTDTHNHRSHRKDGYALPEGVELVSHRLHDAGYFTANMTTIAPGLRASGKTDFNFTPRRPPFDGTHWNQRGKGQPFYAQINFTAPHKGPMWPEARKQKDLVNPEKVELPPYYPDHPVVRDEMANYLDAVNYWDTQVGGVLEALKADGLLDNTAIFVFGDNGRCLIRGKQWLYDPGTQVPLLVRWPGHIKPGTVRRDPVVSLDITATTLEIAGVSRPALMHGQSLIGGKARTHVFTARDRCDMTVDRIRAVRDSRYKLIRNFMPEKPYTQFNDYITKNYPTQRIIKELHAAGKLDAVQAQWMAPRKPDFELYDHAADPHEVNNLAADPKHKQALTRLTGLLDRWIVDSNDHGRTPESRETIEREEPRAKAAIL